MKKSMKKIVSLLCLICVLVGCLPVRTYATDGAVSTSNEIIIKSTDTEKATLGNPATWKTTTWVNVNPIDAQYMEGVEGIFDDDDTTYRTSANNNIKFELSEYSGGIYKLYYLNLTKDTTANADGSDTALFSFRNGTTKVGDINYKPLDYGNGEWIYINTYEIGSDSVIFIQNNKKLTNFRTAALKLVPVEAQIEGVNYESFQDAIESASAGETIEVIGNATLTATVTSKANITINSGVTLDLKGYTLDMGDNFLYSQGDVVDSSGNKAGRLKVAAGKGTLATTSEQVPIYIDGEGYMFATMKEQYSVSISEDKDSFTVISRPSFGGADYAAKLAGGADVAKLQFIIRLDWDEDEESYYQPLKYADNLVETVYKDGKAFSVTVNGLSNYKDSMKVTVLVKSDLGVEWVNNSFYMSTSNE